MWTTPKIIIILAPNKPRKDVPDVTPECEPY